MRIADVIKLKAIAVTVCGFLLAAPAVLADELGGQPGQSNRFHVPIQTENVKGKETSTVTIVIFGSLACDHTLTALELADELSERFAGEVRVVFKHFPIGRSEAPAVLAARAAEAAAAQGKFWGYIESVLQQLRSDPGDAQSHDHDRLVRLAVDSGLDRDRFELDLEQLTQSQGQVERDWQQAKQLGLHGTPSIFINGRYVLGVAWGRAAFHDLVHEEITAIVQTSGQGDSHSYEDLIRNGADRIPAPSTPTRAPAGLR